MSRIPRPYEVYKHFKGNQYQIIAVAEHSETGETLVIYQALYGAFQIYARELSNFMSPVDHIKYPEVAQEQRFELQTGGQFGQEERTELQNIVWQDASQGIASQDNVAQGVLQGNLSQDSVAQGVPQGNASQDSVIQDVPKRDAPRDDTELNLDPLVIEFLDADSYEQRLNILAGLHHRITDEMITTMAISCDIEVEDGPTEQRYEELRTCLLTLEKYECNRVRI